MPTLRRLIPTAVLLAVAFLTACNNNPPPKVVIYTSVDQVCAEPILKNFETETGIKVKAAYDVEASKTVGLEKRLLAEKSSPQADVFWNSEHLRTLRLTAVGELWNSRTLNLLGASLTLAVCTTFTALVLAAAVLWLLAGLHPRLQPLALLAVGITFCLSPVVHLASWQALPFTASLPPLLNAVIVLSWSYFPVALFVLLLGLLRLERAGLEAGLLLGDPAGLFRHLVLPRWRLYSLCWPPPLLILYWRADFHRFFSTHGPALANSLALGLISVTLALVLAHLITDALMTLAIPIRGLLLALLLMQILLPGPLPALGMLELATHPGFQWLRQGDTLLIFTHSLCLLPWLVLLLTSLRAARPPAEQDQARLLGVGWCARQRYLRLPQERPYLLCAAGFGLALALAELSTTVLVVAPGTETVVLRLYNLMHYGDWPAVTALALAQALLIAASILSAVGYIRWRHDHA